MKYGDGRKKFGSTADTHYSTFKCRGRKVFFHRGSERDVTHYIIHPAGGQHSEEDGANVLRKGLLYSQRT